MPAGSHVRLNLQTGQREVRLGEEQLKYWTQNHRCGSRVTPDSYRLGAVAYTREANQTLVERIHTLLSVVKLSLCREGEKIASTLSPENLKQVMKKIKEDLSSVNKDSQKKVKHVDNGFVIKPHEVVIVWVLNLSRIARLCPKDADRLKFTGTVLFFFPDYFIMARTPNFSQKDCMIPWHRSQERGVINSL